METGYSVVRTVEETVTVEVKYSVSVSYSVDVQVDVSVTTGGGTVVVESVSQGVEVGSAERAECSRRLRTPALATAKRAKRGMMSFIVVCKTIVAVEAVWKQNEEAKKIT